MCSRRLIASLTTLALVPTPGTAQDLPDFDPVVERPAYPEDAGERPSVLFDAGHNNTHPPDGNYRAFVELIRADGYRVAATTEPFDSSTLDAHDVLVIATPQPFEDSLVNWSDPVITRANWTTPALSEEECDAIEAWVRGGGSLLLITGHAPRAFWSAPLAGRFGVDVHNSYTADTLNSYRTDDTGPRGAWIVYSRDNGLLAGHPITNGRDERERVRRLRVNGSASLAGPPGSLAFLRLADSAYEWIFHDFAFWDDARHTSVSAAGRAQGVALRHGAGRVVVLAPTAPFSERYLARPETDDRQLALNVMHWLSGVTGPAPLPDAAALRADADELGLPTLPGPVPVRYSDGHASRARALQRGARTLRGLLRDSVAVEPDDVVLFVLDEPHWALVTELPYGVHTLLEGPHPAFLAPARVDRGSYHDADLPSRQAELSVDVTGLHYLAHFYAAEALYAEGQAADPPVKWLDELITLMLEEELLHAVDPELGNAARHSRAEALRLEEPRVTGLAGYDAEYRRYFVTPDGAPNYAWFQARLARWAAGIRSAHGLRAIGRVRAALAGAGGEVGAERTLELLERAGIEVPCWARTGCAGSANRHGMGQEPFGPRSARKGR